MKTIIFKHQWLKLPMILQRAAMAAGLLISFGTMATGVATLGGGPSQGHPSYYGFVNGSTKDVAQFHTPIGLALDSSGDYLYVADRDNNAIRILDLGGGQTYTFTTNLIDQPVGVAVDRSDNVFVLNRAEGTNGTVLEFDYFGDLLATNATSLTNAAGIALNSAGNIYVTASNQLLRITAPGVVASVATITNAGASLAGVVVMASGQVAVCDAGRDGIYNINPSSGLVTTNTGFNGPGDHFGYKTVAQFFQPYGLAQAGNGSLVVADNGNNRVKVVDSFGTVTNLYGVNSNYWVTGTGTYPGWWDADPVMYGPAANNYNIQGSAEARLPAGIVVGSDGTAYVTEDYYHIIREVTGLTPPPPWAPVAPTILSVTTNYGQVSLTWSAVSGATSYNVKRSTSPGAEVTIATNTSTSYTDTSVTDGTKYYYVVSAVNSGGESPNSVEVSATPPIPPPTSPSIGYFDYEGTPPAIVFYPVSGGAFTTHNDLNLGIDPNGSGVATYFTADGTDPSPSNGSTPPNYKNGDVLTVTPMPDLTIKAVNIGPGGTSAVVTAEFIYQVGNPNIIGNNAAQFSVSNVTAGAQMYYTTDGSVPNPTNASAVGPISSGSTISLQFPTGVSNLLFQIQAFKDNYFSSPIRTNIFSATNYLSDTMSFGFASGPGSCQFVASPGQYFTVPVGITLISGASPIYGLQFNVTLTNLTSHIVNPQTIDFGSMLGKPDTNNDGYYLPIPTYMFVSTNQPYNDTNVVQIETNGAWYQNLLFTDTNNEALLGVGWLEIYGRTNLYDTLNQSLLTYPILRGNDPYSDSSQIVGYYTFQIPPDAIPGDVYQIQIGRPSGTTFPNGLKVNPYGVRVTIVAPADTNLVGPGSVNALKDVTIGSIPYLVGDVSPANWFNAGDFGSSYLDNIDVMRVFDFAAYPVAPPPPKSDLFDALDSCGDFGVNNGSGIYTNAGPLTVAQENALFNGNDSTINQIAFGDGKLDVCDVYVTFRRSLDSKLTWFDRFWTNGVREAVTVPNEVPQSQIQVESAGTIQAQTQSLSSTNSPQVNFAATDVRGSAGQTVQIPITAAVFGSYPLRVAMLNLTAVPLDGSPALTSPVTFTPGPVLGAPTSDFTASRGNGNYAAAWLDSTITGISSNAVVGYLNVPIPANATSLSAYAIHFDEASGSPNGLASFPVHKLTGLITLSSRTNSCYNDGIPDSWRLRWFGTTNDLLSVSNACPSGDGVNNWMKYVAGVDPNVAGDFPSLHPKTPVPAGATAAIHWPTVSGKKYVILRSSTLFPGSWTAISTNTGTGTDMEFDDTTAGQAHFYRVRILQ